MSNRDAQTIIGMSREIKELQAKIAELTEELNQADQRADERDQRLGEVQHTHDTIIEKIMNFAPECWNDTPGDEAVIAYVESLNGRTVMTPGHSPDCDCWG